MARRVAKKPRRRSGSMWAVIESAITGGWSTTMRLCVVAVVMSASGVVAGEGVRRIAVSTLGLAGLQP